MNETDSPILRVLTFRLFLPYKPIIRTATRRNEIMRRMQDRRASIQPIKPGLRITILNDNDIRAIDETALKILDEVGVRIPLGRALKIYADAGAKVDFTNQIVRIPPGLVKKSMAKAPRRYILAGRERPELDLDVGGQNGTYFNNTGTTANTIDFVTRKKRPACKDDVVKMAKIVDYLPVISLMWPNVSATEYLQSAPLHELDACFNNTEKHVQTETVMGEIETRYAIEMASAIVGSKERLKERPILSCLICGVAPLGHDKKGLESVLGFAEAGLPVGYMSMPTMGLTAPASQAGAIAVGLAEVLSSTVLVQLVNPGCPCFISIIPGIVDPRSGDYLYGSTSAQIANAAVVQLAHYYEIPVFGGACFGGGCYELNTWQIGRENIYLPLLEVMLGADLCFSMGVIGDDNIFHPARVIFDREIFQAVEIISQGIEVTTNTLLFDVIREVGPGGHFLGQRHTAEHLPELWPPSVLFERSKDLDERYKDPVEVAWEEINWILENHQVPELDSKTRDELKRIVEAAEEELRIR
jgi:trimethylamine--corrinoid protein Co-methyltransferase